MTSCPVTAEPLVIVGAGGHGREMLDIVEAINREHQRFDVRGFVADEAEVELVARRGVPWLGGIDELKGIDASYVIGIGSSEARRRIDAELRDAGKEPATLIHPLASLGSDLRLGAGVVAAAGARLTTNVTMGRHSQLNVNAVVSHDCDVGAYVTLSPGVLVNGDCRIGDGAFLGTGAVVVRGHSVGAGAVIGAGAVVVDDVPERVTAKGVPARW
jgi:sugar O-acyltransferase (sialic acid O-acetyltransferase NeuD family)